MKPALVDISVLMLFHARADHFGKVWEEVRKARPKRLFLYQDGPRLTDKDGMPVTDMRLSKDWEGIAKCRRMADDSNIDWECEVHRNYQERNLGCDPSEFLSQQWAFSLTDKCVVLEDDDVPSLSFFTFCKEMLDRYENDPRVTMIAGFNTDEDSRRFLKATDGTVPDYFFTRAFSIWGWASWARVIRNLDGEYGFVKDGETFCRLKEKAAAYGQRSEMIDLCRQHSTAGKPYYETILWAYMILNDGLAVMPSVNLINNIGLDGGTHYSTQLELLPKRLRRQFTMARHELRFPLSHPAGVEEEPGYQERWYLRNAWNNPWRKVQYSFEELWLNLRKGNFRTIIASVNNRIKKTLR
ncbi:MAG: hemolysin activation protein [Bacteroidales bacterium]|nr:hemolysin activation protein [Bacteroidales bacterium]MCM1148365.1 hemolysin activation protein [Bacteroidales bacterium]MCM1207038.1 hemolysin activation protein [Bacillota bacterium]MCM1511309.1 hypothetical protein [Clostridium sp.]